MCTVNGERLCPPPTPDGDVISCRNLGLASFLHLSKASADSEDRDTGMEMKTVTIYYAVSVVFTSTSMFFSSTGRYLKTAK